MSDESMRSNAGWLGLFGIDPDWPMPLSEQEAHELRRILTDLITELVGDDGDGHEMTPDGEACAVCVAIDRAEARLREVGGDE